MSGKPFSTTADDAAMHKMAASDAAANTVTATGAQVVRRPGEKGRWS